MLKQVLAFSERQHFSLLQARLRSLDRPHKNPLIPDLSGTVE
jgi:hypothetical protein